MPAAALPDKVAIITGAASGIGAATAERFIAEGARVMLADIDGAAAEAVAARLGPHACAARGNHCVPEDNARVVAETLARFGHVDILYNNAGVLSRGALDTIEGDTLRAVLDANLVGPALMSRACLAALRESARLGRAPCILFTGSIQSLMVRPGFAAYGSSKHGVAGLASTLALELAPEGIRVNALCPGPVDTPLFRQSAAPAGAVGPSIEQLAAGIPLGRLIRVEEVASAALFLCSDQASAISGVLLPVDGAITAR
uniref:Putative oxidoreductase n=1 Tax=Variovorax sp. DB1 TaxID=1179817 RepID=I3RYF2_9BURK|nr:SDR family oxidoreductase [Variovorax sp. DB1]AFK33039.1 putative oxidoreductase [Variovorax sp. DB1]